MTKQREYPEGRLLISFRVTPEVAERLRAVRKHTRRGTSAELEVALEQYLARVEPILARKVRALEEVEAA